MSIDPSDMIDGIPEDASRLLARGAADDVRADRRIAAAIDDFFIDDESRLDDRLRSRLAEMLRRILAAIEGELRQHAARLLGGRGEPGLAAAIADGAPIVHAELARAGLLNDRAVMRELLGRAAQERLGEMLPGSAPDHELSIAGDRPSLLVRLAASADGIIAAAATAMMIADARRRSACETEFAVRSDLPAELQHRLVWRAAAVLRQAFAGQADAPVGSLDRALTEAAERSLAAHDEGDRLEASAMRLASALAIGGDDLGPMLIEALADRRVALFIALLARPLGLGYDAAREILLDPAPERLWLALRAVALDRATIAAIGLALCDADPNRDVDAFADLLDAIAAISPDAALAALATLCLHPDFRAAVIKLERAGRP